MMVRWPVVSMSVAVALCATACDSVSDDPVPTLAEAPFVCDGVPLEGVRLMSGVSEVGVEWESGAWGDVSDGFACGLHSGDETSVLTVSQTPLEWYGAESAEGYIAPFAGREGAQEIAADAPGAGYAYPEGENLVTAQWACGESRLVAHLYVQAGGDRDPFVDVSRYMVSILPWACGDQEAPQRTVED